MYDNVATTQYTHIVLIETHLVSPPPPPTFI